MVDQVTVAQPVIENGLELNTRHLYDIMVTMGSRADLGDTPRGNRLIVALSGGTVSGPFINGIVEPVGADWAVIRQDGTIELDVRAQVRTHDDAVIYISYHGFLRGEASVLQRLMTGQAVEPCEYYMRSAPRLETGSPKYAWLNSIIAVGVGRVDFAAGEVHYRVYEVL